MTSTSWKVLIVAFLLLSHVLFAFPHEPITSLSAPDAPVALPSAESSKGAVFTFRPADDLYNNQWGLHQTHLSDAWDIWVGGHDVMLSTVDVGLDIRHEEMQTNLWTSNLGLHGINAFGTEGDEDNAAILDWYGVSLNAQHGTNVAGLATGLLSKWGTAAPSNARILPIKFAFYCPPFGTMEDQADTLQIADAMREAFTYGVRIFSMSFVYAPGEDYRDIADAIEDLWQAGALFFGGVGNDGIERSLFPANHSKVMAVGAVTSTGAVWEGSNRGPHLDLVAPGGESTITTTMPRWTCDGAPDYNPNLTSYVGDFGGTSASAPFAAGVAATLWSFNPGKTNAQIRDLLEGTADDIAPQGWDNATGHGRVNLTRALLQSRVSHAPIEILSDADFCDGDDDGVVNCATADGSASAPYVISGWRIDPETAQQAILIDGVSKNFTVEHNLIHNLTRAKTASGIVIRDATSPSGAVVHRNSINNLLDGIVLEDSAVRVRNNSIANNSASGIRVVSGLPYINDNSIYANGEWGLLNEEPLQYLIDATYNYWGTTLPNQTLEPGPGSHVSLGAVLTPFFTDFARSVYYIAPQQVYYQYHVQEYHPELPLPTVPGCRIAVQFIQCPAVRPNVTRLAMPIPPNVEQLLMDLQSTGPERFDLFAARTSFPAVATPATFDWSLQGGQALKTLDLLGGSLGGWYSFTAHQRNMTGNVTFYPSYDYRPTLNPLRINDFDASSALPEGWTSSTPGSGESVGIDAGQSVTGTRSLKVTASDGDGNAPWARWNVTVPTTTFRLDLNVRPGAEPFQNFTLLQLGRKVGERAFPLLELRLSNDNALMDVSNGTVFQNDVASLRRGGWNHLSVELREDFYHVFLDHERVGTYALQSLLHPHNREATISITLGGLSVTSKGSAAWDDVVMTQGQPLQGALLDDRLEAQGLPGWVVNIPTQVASEKSSRSYAKSRSLAFQGTGVGTAYRNLPTFGTDYLASIDFRIDAASNADETDLLHLRDGSNKTLIQVRFGGSDRHLNVTSGAGYRHVGQVPTDQWHHLKLRSFGSHYNLYMNETFLGTWGVRSLGMPATLLLGGSSAKWLADNVQLTPERERFYESWESDGHDGWSVAHEGTGNSRVEVVNLDSSQSARTIGAKVLLIKSALSSPTRAMAWRSINASGSFRAETQFFLPSTGLAKDNFFVLALNQSATMKVGVALKEATDESVDLYIIGSGWQSNVESITVGDWHRIALDVERPGTVYLWVGQTRHGPYSADVGPIDTVALGDFYTNTLPTDPIGAGEGYWDDVYIWPLNAAPTPNISSPAAAASVAGTVTISGTALDPDPADAPRSVEVAIDSGTWQVASGTLTWSYSWDTTMVPNGSHTIKVRAGDGRTMSDVVKREVHVQN